MTTGPKPRPTSERFHGLYEIDVASGCWLWSHVTDRGYGTIGHTVAPGVWKSVLAHRFSYEMHHGPIPDGMVVDHMCNVRRCVNPAHLQVLTSRQNIERSSHPVIERQRQRRCVRDHDLTDPANVYRRPDNGHVMCKECTRIRARILQRDVDSAMADEKKPTPKSKKRKRAA